MGKYLDISRSAAAQPRYDRNDIDDQRQVALARQYDQNDIDDQSLAQAQPFGRLNRFGRTFQELERRCPAYVAPAMWQQAVEDGRRFLAAWGEQAEALGWTARELFGLHTPPEQPAASYQRLSRYDETGLVWLLQGRPVVALTAGSAAIQTASGGTLTYRKVNKPASGPVGDSLDNFDGVV